MQRDRRVRVGGELLTFAAVEVGVEAEAASVDAAEQHHARRRSAVGRAGRDDHGVGLQLTVLPGVVEPTLELHERVGVEVVRMERTRGNRHEPEATA